MPRLVLFELALLLAPFILFGIYRFAVRDAQMEGRKAWPINLLFGVGVVLAIIGWIFFILQDDRNTDICIGPATADPVSGEIIPGQEYQCDLGLSSPGGAPAADPAL